jgi:hypothetical protein
MYLGLEDEAQLRYLRQLLPAVYTPIGAARPLTIVRDALQNCGAVDADGHGFAASEEEVHRGGRRRSGSNYARLYLNIFQKFHILAA